MHFVSCVIWVIHRWLNNPGNICIIYHNWNWFQDRGARVKLDALAETQYGHDARMFVMPRCTSEDSTIRCDANTFVIGTILTNRLIHRVSQFEYTHAISLEKIFNFYHHALIFDEGENNYFLHIEFANICRFWYFSFFFSFPLDNC